ncbi:MAG TPA: ATP-dependent helicase, partial [Ktedonobacteraceae bacterium]
KTALTEFGRLMTDLTSAIDELALPELLDRIAEKSGYGPELRGAPESDLDRWANVLELRRVAEDYSEIETSVALELFLENIALVGGADTTQTGENGKLIQEENTDAVTLITLHAAKGLEYPVVFIVGMDEGSLPHARSVDKPEQLEEERRLAYVGFTRAMRRLYLVRAYRRSFFGETHPTEPSRFLDDIPSYLVANPATPTTTRDAGGRRSQTSTRTTQPRRSNWDEDDYNQDPDYSRDTGRTFGSGKSSNYGGNSSAKPGRIIPPSWAPRTGSYSSPTVPPSSPSGQKLPPQPAPQPEKPKEQQYKPGDKVRHDKFGEGVILKSEMEQNTEFVEVQFKGKTGKKRLSMDFARLEKI